MSKEAPKKMTGVYLDLDVWVRVKNEASREGRSFSNHINIILREQPKIKYKRVNTARLSQEIFDLFQEGTPEIEKIKIMIDERLGV